jgi:hypothetical protein
MGRMTAVTLGALLWGLMFCQAPAVGGDSTPDELVTRCTEDLSRRLGVGPEVIGLEDAWPVELPGDDEGAAAQGSVVLLRGPDGTHMYRARPGDPLHYAGTYRQPPDVDFQQLTAEGSPYDGLQTAVVGALMLRDDEVLLVDAPLRPGQTAPLPGMRILVAGIIAAPVAQRLSESGQAWGRVVGRLESKTSEPAGHQWGERRNIPFRMLGIRFQPLEPLGPMPGLFSLADLAAQADECHSRVVAVRGAYVTHFEYDGLKPDTGDEPVAATCWLSGDLTGIASAIVAFAPPSHSVEVAGILERRAEFDGTNGYGHLGADRFRLNVIAGHFAGTEVDYARAAGQPAAFAREPVTIRGLLARDGDEAFLIHQGRGAGEDSCHLAGDLSGLAAAPEDAPGPMPVQITGTLAAAGGFDGSNGYGRDGRHRLELTAVFARPLWEEPD